jgi:type IV pilus assembly protein PilX
MASHSSASPHPPLPLGQHGAALATTLILLVIITLVALGATRFVAQEEKMAGAILDRAIAFQSAEAGLRRAETLAEQSTPPTARPNDSDGTCTQTACSGGLCAPPDLDCIPRWQDPNFTGWVPILEPPDVPLPVEGFYEYLNTMPAAESDSSSINNPHLIRIIVRTGRTSGATVILESLYQRP